MIIPPHINADEFDPGDPDYLGWLEEQAFFEKERAAGRDPFEGIPDADNPEPDPKPGTRSPTQDEIARAHDIVCAANTERLGALIALHQGYSRTAVRAAVWTFCRDKIEPELIKDLGDTAVDGDDYEHLVERARELADEEAGPIADKALQHAEEDLPCLNAYEAIHPHVHAPPDDQAARDYGAARACLAAGHTYDDILMAMHVRYGDDAESRGYSRQIVQRALDANRPSAQATPKPGGDAPKPRAPW